MKLIYLLFGLINCDRIIKNINIPSCRNCIHYKPNPIFNDFTSSFSKCDKFGEKNIITDKITYNYVDSCRDNESLCGKNGNYFEEEKNINIKILKHKIISNMQYNLFFVVLSLYIYILYFININK
jgi:hypothetical protein